MGRVSQETIEKLTAFMDSLSADAMSKCALCNETLTHIVKQAEVQTGAGTATVTRVLSERLNEGAADGDRVSGRKLEMRVHRVDAPKITNRDNNPPTDPSPKTKKVSQKVIWRRVDVMLEKLAKYMMENCETPADIDEGTKIGILNNISLLYIYEKDLLGAEGRI